MRFWQKIILAVLVLIALAALGGAGTMALGIWQPGDLITVAIPIAATPVAADPDARGEAASGPGPSPTSSTTAGGVQPTVSLTATPFQPVPFTSTPLPTPTPTQTHTSLPTSTPVPTATPSAPDAVFIEGIWGFPQTYNLSCESRSASDLARYYGVYFTELEFLWALPTSDNPDVGFVGDVTGYLGQLPPLGYGVHANPVAALMRDFGLNATAHKGMSLDLLKNELAAGRPVMIWAIRDLGTSEPVEYTASDGDITIVARFEHTFIVIGYSKDSITVLDNHRVYSVSTRQFMDSWNILGRMGITIAGP